MATQIINTDPNQVKAIRVQQSSALSQLLPALSIGDTLTLTVRQNNSGGQGLIFVRGQLIPAMLPEQYQPGQRFLAQVTDNNEQVLFKVLEKLTPTKFLSDSPAVRLAQEIKELIQRPNDAPLAKITDFKFSEIVKEFISGNKSLEQLLNLVNSSKELTNPTNVLSQLISSSDGSLVETLRQAATKLRAYIGEETLTPPQRTLLALHSELADLLTQIKERPQYVTSKLLYLSEQVTLQLKDLQSDKRNIKETLTQISNLLEQMVSDKSKGGELLRTAIQLLEAHDQFPQSISEKLDPRTASQLREVATRLEQIANTQDLLRQLNPLMQALGEPAIILFPFLFHGLLSYSEVTVENHLGGKKKSTGEEGKKQDQQSFQRVQVTVPLPSLGNVDVDIAHRDKEILVRLTVEDQEIAAFILEQLEHLASLLREQGFERAELVSHVGKTGTHKPTNWSFGIHASASILA